MNETIINPVVGKYFKLSGLIGFLFMLFCANAAAREYPARLDWVQRVELTTPVGGVVDEVHVKPGERVKKDETLLALEPAIFKTRIRDRGAQLNKMTALRDEAQRELERAQNLYDRTLLSDHELQVAKNAQIATSADYESAAAELKQAQIEFDYSKLRAPFDALVVQRKAEKGMVVAPQLQPQTLIVVASSGKMRARTMVGASELNSFKLGQEANVILNGERYFGKVVHKGLEPMDAGNNYILEVEFITGDRIFSAGQDAKIEL